MTKIIKLLDATFDASGNAELAIPYGTEIHALKFFENAPVDIGQRIAVVVSLNEPPTSTGSRTRMFTIIPDGHPEPANFLKYVATFPYGPTKILVHCIELGRQETGSFNPESAIIT